MIPATQPYFKGMCKLQRHWENVLKGRLLYCDKERGGDSTGWMDWIYRYILLGTDSSVQTMTTHCLYHRLWCLYT